MTDKIRVLMELIKCAVFSECSINTELTDGVEVEEWLDIFRIASRHDIAHIAGDAAIRHNLIPDGELKDKLSRKIVAAMQRYYNFENELTQVSEVFETENIPYIPLKGSVLRKYYRSPWMRTSCDIDILVHEDDLDRAESALKQKMGYSFSDRKAHDISGVSPSGVNLELHFTLKEVGRELKADTVLENVWNYASPKSPDSCCFVLTGEMFYYYHIAHMAKHFGIGGCGIRTFVDVAVLNHADIVINRDLLSDLFSEGGLSKFAKESEHLAGVWFEGAEHDEVTSSMETYLIEGGTYGSRKNNISSKQIDAGGKRKYVFSRIWLPADKLKEKIPTLKKYPFLLPYYEIKRWFHAASGKKMKRSLNEISLASSIESSKIDKTRIMFQKLGLI